MLIIFFDQKENMVKATRSKLADILKKTKVTHGLPAGWSWWSRRPPSGTSSSPRWLSGTRWSTAPALPPAQAPTMDTGVP